MTRAGSNYFAWSGLLMMVACFFVHFGVINNTASSFWYTREYEIVKKNQSEHLYKGRYEPEYYLTVKYTDDSTYLYTERVGGEQYFSSEIYRLYTKRAVVKGSGYEAWNWTTIVFMFFGAVSLSIGLANKLVY